MLAPLLSLIKVQLQLLDHHLSPNTTPRFTSLIYKTKKRNNDKIYTDCSPTLGSKTNKNPSTLITTQYSTSNESICTSGCIDTNKTKATPSSAHNSISMTASTLSGDSKVKAVVVTSATVFGQIQI